MTLNRKIRYSAGVAALVVAGVLAACSAVEQEILPAMRPLSKDAMMLLGKKGMTTEAPIFVRVFKEESELEVWKAREDGYYWHFKTYPICNWSGELGPKMQQGDKQAPEGFYSVTKGQMNPRSQFHLAFNLGYPNAFDRAHKRTGSALMVHGKCRSAGCYAMTDALMEEIYALARDQFAAGHESFPVHAYPFRMTDENMARHKDSQWLSFWKTLKEGYDFFETTRQVPPVAICERKYHVAAKPMLHNTSTRIDPEGRCPRFERLEAKPFTPVAAETQKVADAHVVAPGPKMRGVAAADGGGGGGGILSGLSGLFGSAGGGDKAKAAGLGFSGRE